MPSQIRRDDQERGGSSLKQLPRREEFLEAAVRRFSKFGYAETSTREICNDVGVAPSAMYNYFKSKEEILVAIENRAIMRLQAGLDKLLTNYRGKNVEEIFELVLGYTVDYALMHRESWTSWHETRRALSPKNRRAFIRDRDRCEAVYRKLFTEAIACGIFPRQDAKLAVLYFFGIVDGMARWYCPDGPVSRTDLVRHAVKFFIQAVKSNGS